MADAKDENASGNESLSTTAPESLTEDSRKSDKLKSKLRKESYE